MIVTRSALFLLAAAVLGCAEADKGKGVAGNAPAAKGPSAEKEGVTWTHADLLEHLKAKGLVFETAPLPGGGVLMPGGGAAAAIITFAGPPRGSVMIWQMPTAQLAREINIAQQWPQAPDGKVAGADGLLLQWGRFVLSVGREDARHYLDEIKKVLGD